MPVIIAFACGGYCCLGEKLNEVGGYFEGIGGGGHMEGIRWVWCGCDMVD